ncbi:MAG: substrate-binding periplasmic protein [Kordiimonas sp.]
MIYRTSKRLKVKLLSLPAFLAASVLLTSLFNPVLFASNQTDSNEPILVIAGHIESRLDDNPNSPYRRVLTKILPAEKAEYRLYPVPRTLRDFGKETVSCIFPTSIDILHLLTDFPADQMIQSLPIDRVSSHIFTSPSAKVISATTDLKDKSIVVRQAVVEEHIDFPGVKTIVRTVDNQSALRMLLAGRADVMYGWIPDVYDIADEHGLTPPTFDPSLTIYATNIYLTCKNNKKTQNLLSQVNSRIQALKNSGNLREILGKNARLVD